MSPKKAANRALGLALCLTFCLGGLSACGPMPPSDPYNLSASKDAASRGHYWYRRGCYAEAERFFEQSLAYARLSDNVPLMVLSRNALGTSALAQVRLSEAAAALEAALELSQTQPGLPELPAILGNLGSLAWKSGREADAIGFWEEAAARAVEKGENPARFRASLSRLYLARGQMEAFQNELNLALAALEKSPAKGASENEIALYQEARADALNLAAQEKLSSGQYAEALVFLEEALDLDRQTESQIGLSQDLETLASIQEGLGQRADAAISLDRAFYLRAALRDREGMAKIMARIEKLDRENALARNLEDMRKIIKNPKLFDPIQSLCP